MYHFFRKIVVKANKLIEKAELPEIIGCWLTKPREDTSTVNHETVHLTISSYIFGA